MGAQGPGTEGLPSSICQQLGSEEVRPNSEDCSGTGVLTVGETPDFLSVGGMLSFSFKNDSLQFEVNLVAVNEAHLRVSSKLLALARRVVNERVHRKDGKTRKWIQTVSLPANSSDDILTPDFLTVFLPAGIPRNSSGDSDSPSRLQNPPTLRLKPGVSTSKPTRRDVL
jgi:hypothetical protein